MSCKKIMGVCIENRVKEAGKVQEVLTKYGCSIKARIGLHEAGSESCSASGIIILELCGSPEEKNNLEKELRSIEGVKIGKMIFDE